MSKSTYAIGGCISVRVRMLERGGGQTFAMLVPTY